MLTPDQIASFKRRAAAGEMPQHPGWEQYDGFIWAIKTPFYIPIRVMEFCGNSFDMSFSAGELTHRWSFTSLPAAQLAAEALLMEATAPLWAETVKALKQAAAALRKIQNISDKTRDSATAMSDVEDVLLDTDLAGIESAAKKASKGA